MFLFIDPTQIDKTTIILIDNGKIYKRSWQSKLKQSETLLVEIKKFLKLKNRSWRDVSKIAVVTGPGPFSRIRTGVAMANALAFALDISIVSIKQADKDLFKILKQKGQKMVEPTYDKSAHITYPKKY